MKLRPGDIVFTEAQGGGFVSRMITWWTRTWFEPPTRASHVAVVVEPSEYLEDTLLVEQTWPRIGRTSLGKYLTSSGVYIYRDRQLDEEVSGNIAKSALKSRGRYGWTKIILFLLDAIVGKIISLPVVLLGFLFGRRWKGIEPAIFSHINLTGTVVCSQFVAKLFWDQGYHFGRHYNQHTPDSLMDYCEREEERFERII